MIKQLTMMYKAKINKCTLAYKRLNGVCSNYVLELLKRNIDKRSRERQSRYGSNAIRKRKTRPGEIKF